MNLESDFELENTRAKLKRLSAQYEKCKKEPYGNEAVQRLSLRSLKRLMNQMEEEIARYECGVKACK